jgi:hypothetical protein
MLMYRRWFFSNIAGCTIGIGAGLFLMSEIFDFLSKIFSVENCSGMPCGEHLGIVTILSGVMGGIAGGIIDYTISQLIAHHKIAPRHLLGFALMGGLLWPLVGIFSFVSFFTYILTFHSWFDSLSRTSLHFDIYVYVMFFILCAVFPGIVLGTIIALLRIRWGNYTVSTTQR